MTLRNRIERLEAAKPDTSLDLWQVNIIIGGGNGNRTFARHLVTGVESEDPELLEALHRASIARCDRGEYDTFEVIIGSGTGSAAEGGEGGES